MILLNNDRLSLSAGFIYCHISNYMIVLIIICIYIPIFTLMIQGFVSTINN